MTNKDKNIKRQMRIYKHGCKKKDIVDLLAEGITDIFKTRKESKHYGKRNDES